MVKVLNSYIMFILAWLRAKIFVRSWPSKHRLITAEWEASVAKSDYISDVKFRKQMFMLRYGYQLSCLVRPVRAYKCVRAKLWLRMNRSVS